MSDTNERAQRITLSYPGDLTEAERDRVAARTISTFNALIAELRRARAAERVTR